MTQNDKPKAAELGWRLRATNYVYQSDRFDLRQDDLSLPDGEFITFTYVEHPGFVTIVPVTDEGEVVLIRSYRYTVDDWVWELPAGGLGNKPDLLPEAVALEELKEETGHVVKGTLRLVATYYCAVGNARMRGHVFLATGVHREGEQHLEHTEVIQLRLVPIAEALRMARAGEMEDGASALALLLCEPHLVPV